MVIMEENMKNLGQTLEVAEESIDLDELIDKVNAEKKKTAIYAVAVWVVCVISFVVKFVIW